MLAGYSADTRKTELAKLKSLSVTMYRQDLKAAARTTFCYRRMLIDLEKPTFGACVVNVPCYATLPDIVSALLSVACCISVVNYPLLTAENTLFVFIGQWNVVWWLNLSSEGM
jgi:hypothetical protein